MMPIEVGYLTLSVRDVKQAMAFFGALFDWQFEHQGPQAAHVANTKLPLGLTGGGPAELPFVYFRVENLDAVKAKLLTLGGTVRQEQEYPSGLNAICEDDQGTVFSLWQPAPGM